MEQRRHRKQTLKPRTQQQPPPNPQSKNQNFDLQNQNPPKKSQQNKGRT